MSTPVATHERPDAPVRAEAPGCEPPENPVTKFLRTDRLPHIWCAGCGIGTSVNCFARAVDACKIPLDNISVVSGIGCTGRVAGYLRLDSFHTTHGRAIPFATGLKLANPELKVVVYSGDGDLTAIGGNHLIHAGRRNVDLTVICVNNFTYGMTGGQVAPTTPLQAVATTTPYGNLEEPFNLCHLADSAGAVYVARWTTYHVRQLQKSITKALQKHGFSFVEVLSPCPTLYGRRNRVGDGLAMERMFKERCVIKNGAATHDTAFDALASGQIPIGDFVDRDRPAFLQRYNQVMRAQLGDDFVPYGEPEIDTRAEADQFAGPEG
ncbi:MAG: 2-oxoacid:ferredoxin oxidoreductase subunit beta [Deltaproteobacteria bacterium]|nr:2-oxoacid:ferredoxin oxidoreductase subunit beta [Deltaproteobacteria bacterium]